MCALAVEDLNGDNEWGQIVALAEAETPCSRISDPDFDRMKSHGVFRRRHDLPEHCMLRIRVTACELTSEQARTVAMTAYRHGHGIVDVTHRGGLQIQGVEFKDVPAAMEALQEAGLTCWRTGRRHVRNIYCHPLSGLDPEEIIDTREICFALTDQFARQDSTEQLPHKFNIAVCGRESADSFFWTQDLAFLAHRSDQGEPLFHVLIGGRGGEQPELAKPLPVFVRVEQIVAVTAKILDLYKAAQSNNDQARFRLADLVDELGIGGVLDFLEAALDFPLLAGVTAPSPPTAHEDLIGWFAQKQPEAWAMGLCVPLGRLTWQQLEGVAVAAGRWGDGTLRTTPQQGLIVPGVSSGFRDSVATEAARFGLSPFAGTLSRNISACTGRQFCDLAVTETKAHALKLAEQLRQKMLTLHGIRIAVSGCSSGCARHLTADIGLQGVRIRRLLGAAEGFDVYLGGGIAGQIHLALPYRFGVTVDRLPRLIEQVVREYYLKHRPGYTFSAYWRERLHKEQAEHASDEDYVAPIWTCESCGHRHEGEDPPVYCPKCAALRRHFVRWDPESSDAEEPRSTAAFEPVWELPEPLANDVSSSPPIDLAVDPIRKVTESLVDWLEQFSQEQSRKPKPKRGRPRDPKVAERDKLIRQLARERSELSHSELAELVSDLIGEEVTTHVIRNAMKRARGRRRA